MYDLYDNVIIFRDIFVFFLFLLIDRSKLLSYEEKNAKQK